MGTGKLKAAKDSVRKAAFASINEAAGKMVSPVSMFGSMGANPNINFLTNANALSQQQVAQKNIQPLGVGSTQVMTGGFDPLAQQVSMGIFGDQNARSMAVRGSGLMMKALGSEPNVDPCSEEFDYEIATDAGHSAEDIRKYREENCKNK